MKRLLIILSIILMGGFVACNDNSLEAGKIVITSGAESRVGMVGGRVVITYTTKGDVSPEDIEVTTTSEWLKVFDAKRLGEVVLMAAENQTGGTRMAAVTITTNTQVVTVVVNQSGTPEPPKVTLTSSPELSIDRAGQVVEITYEIENPTFDGYTFATIDVDWIYAIDTTNTGKVILYIATNATDASRTANITVGYDNATADVVLTQAGEGDFNFTATHLEAQYYGDFYTPGASNYFLIFSDRGFSAEESSLPFGTYYRIDVYGLVLGEDDITAIPEGEYTYDPENTYMTWTFVAEYSDFFVNDKNAKNEKIKFDSGKMVVKKDSITLDLVIEGKKHHVEYKGSTAVEDLRGDVNILTTLEEDYALDLSNHYMIHECYGDYYNFGYTNWMLVIMPENGEGDCIQLDFNTAYSNEADGFTGVYEASDYLAPSAFIPGWVQSGVLECSWFFTADQEELAPMRGGKVEIKANDDGTYTVDIDVTDDLRNRIYGSWTGYGYAYEE